jgi:Leucine-rich repeat (LRR) protein
MQPHCPAALVSDLLVVQHVLSSGSEHLSGNLLTTLLLRFVQLSYCPQVLNLSGNSLSALPPFFSCLRGLQQLVLASTDLLLLPGFISSLSCLTHLNMASNKLQVGSWWVDE